MTSVELQRWPIVVFQSRYQGVYEGGLWFALANCEQIPEGPWGDDDECLDWFTANELVAGVGDTPDEAVTDLLRKDEIRLVSERIARGEYKIGKSQENIT